jgi:hypothetical protein
LDLIETLSIVAVNNMAVLLDGMEKRKDAGFAEGCADGEAEGSMSKVNTDNDANGVSGTNDTNGTLTSKSVISKEDEMCDEAEGKEGANNEPSEEDGSSAAHGTAARMSVSSQDTENGTKATKTPFISKEEPLMDDGVSDTSNTTTKKSVSSKEEPGKEECANGTPTKEEEKSEKAKGKEIGGSRITRKTYPERARLLSA